MSHNALHAHKITPPTHTLLTGSALETIKKEQGEKRQPISIAILPETVFHGRTAQGGCASCSRTSPSCGGAQSFPSAKTNTLYQCPRSWYKLNGDGSFYYLIMGGSFIKNSAPVANYNDLPVVFSPSLQSSPLACYEPSTKYFDERYAVTLITFQDCEII